VKGKITGLLCTPDSCTWLWSCWLHFWLLLLLMIKTNRKIRKITERKISYRVVLAAHLELSLLKTNSTQPSHFADPATTFFSASITFQIKQERLESLKANNF
jgi:hypothetical protein